ncbi:MAG: bifunctional adenosylcobinamide kinase/adenosylcobinamide-phosphate guanylyltransferase [Deltaproteobacteria bacterium]|nr:bifunctional adenosylcobinamide kinase/adenosylcobinamide-phosphate guanylyltransferase [Deltaproteobacteria bacterium]
MRTDERLILVGGGVRSGKSAFAQSLAERIGTRRVYLATAQAGDAEMAQRILRHREARGDRFDLIEEPVHVASALSRLGGYDVVVLDCLTLWMSNLLLRGITEEQALAELAKVLDVLCAKTLRCIVVTNEVGMGIVPESPLGRAFRDLAGRAHQELAAAASQVYFAVLGCMLRIKPGPVALFQESP